MQTGSQCLGQYYFKARGGVTPWVGEGKLHLRIFSLSLSLLILQSTVKEHNLSSDLNIY